MDLRYLNREKDDIFLQKRMLLCSAAWAMITVIEFDHS